MKEYIDKAALIKAIGEAGRDVVADYGPEYGTEWGFSWEAIKEILQDIHAADVAEVRHGEWVEYPRAHYFKCSACKCTVPYRKAVLINEKRQYNYCPNCGARMDKEDEHEAG